MVFALHPDFEQDVGGLYDKRLCIIENNFMGFALEHRRRLPRLRLTFATLDDSGILYTTSQSYIYKVDSQN